MSGRKNLRLIVEEIKIYPVCKRCGRKLKSEEARERGMGKVCWGKSQQTTDIARLFIAKKGDGIIAKSNT